MGHGLLLLDKPIGLSSNVALQKAKRALGADKAGHTGSLDPLASGLLPLCIGEATKFSQFLLDADKTYSARFQLGVTTASGDAEGAVLVQRPVQVGRADIEAAMAAFRGDILQIPPIYSAIKYQGQPLYKIARRGGSVEIQPRAVRINRYQLLECGDDWLDVEVACSKGTYIRSLATDLGEALGCGAHVTALRRLAVAGFTLEQALTLEALDPTTPLLPTDQAMLQLPTLTVTDAHKRALLYGQTVQLADEPAAQAIRLYDAQHLFLGVGELGMDGLLKPKRMMRIAPDALSQTGLDLL